jgi:hypothetical protein
LFGFGRIGGRLAHQRICKGFGKLWLLILDLESPDKLPIALLANVHPNDVVRDDVLVALEHLEIREKLGPSLELATLVDDKLVRQEIRATLVGCRKVWILNRVKHVKQDCLLSGRESRRRLVEDAAIDLSHVVVALVHLEFQERPAHVAHGSVRGIESSRG